MVLAPTLARQARFTSSVLILCAAQVLMVYACTRTTASPTPAPSLAAPRFVARVVSACRETAVGPAVGPYSQVNLIVAIPPAKVANAGIIVSVRAAVYTQRGATQPFMASADAFMTGDELEVWHDGMPAIESSQAPPGAPTFHATKIVIHRGSNQTGRPLPSDTLVSCG